MGDIVNIEVQAWWLLVVPLLLIFSLFIIALIMKGKTNENEKNIKENEKKKNKTLTSWIEKKDILYWLLIMCLTAISIFTFQYSGDKNVINHWGFAGTIVSIILAVVAIGFTLYQSLSSEFSSSKITESAEIISKVSEELNSSDLAKAGEIINRAALDMSKYHSELEEKIISRVIGEIGDLKNFHEDKFEGINKTVNNLFSSKQSSSAISDNIVISIDVFIDQLLNVFNVESRIYCYVVLALAHNNISPTDEDFEGTKFVRMLATMKPGEKDNDNEFKDGIDLGYGFGSFTRIEEWFWNVGILKSFMNNDADKQIKLLKEIEKAIPAESVNHFTAFIQ